MKVDRATQCTGPCIQTGVTAKPPATGATSPSNRHDRKAPASILQFGDT